MEKLASLMAEMGKAAAECGKSMKSFSANMDRLKRQEKIAYTLDFDESDWEYNYDNEDEEYD